MQIKIEIGQIGYEEIEAATRPYAEKNPAWAEPIANIINTLAEVPAEKKNEAVAGFVAEHNDQILTTINDLLTKKELGISVSGLSVSQPLVIGMEIDRIDYPVVVEKFLPTVKKSLLKMGGAVKLLHPMIEKASAQQICGILDRIPGNKESILANLVNQNQEKLIKKIESIAKKKKVQLTVASIQVQA